MKTLVKTFGALLIAAAFTGAALGATDQPAPPAPGHSTSVPLAPDAPSSYIVKRGDTLWAIAGKFLSQPWYWPEIWYLNPEIKNPHLIYPGDTLHLVYDANGRPHIEVERGDLGRAADAKLSPQVRTTPLDEAIKAIPYEIVAAFMSKPGVLNADDVKHGAYVAALGERRVIAGVGDILYARGLTGACYIILIKLNKWAPLLVPRERLCDRSRPWGYWAPASLVAAGRRGRCTLGLM